jgi:hypothetical protein
MKSDKLIPGVVLILVGAVILLHNYGYVDVHWRNFIYLWPIFIVMAGINLIFAHNKSAWATMLKLGVLIVGFGLVLFGNFGSRYNFWPHNTYYFNDNDNDSDDDDDDDNAGRKIVKVEGNSVFNEPYTTDVKVAHLNINGGGSLYTLNDTTSQLFNAATKEHKGRYSFSSKKTDSLSVLTFDMKGMRGFRFNFDDDNDNKDHDYGRNNFATFKLNPNPEWDIDVKTGASKLDFDLTKFKITSLKLSGGAADFDIKMGMPLTTTNIIVSTGMSATTINIPAGAACRITSSTGLSSTNFDGFIKKADDTYETAGFATATNKLYIKMSGGMADFKVKRY